MMAKVSLTAQIAAVESMRDILLGRISVKMRPAERDLLNQQLGAAVASLAWCQHHLDDIRAFAERRAAARKARPQQSAGGGSD